MRCSFGGRAAFGLVLMASGAASAHGLSVLGTGTAAECNALLPVIFGPHTAFSAVAHVTEKDQAATVPRTRELVYYFDSGKLHLEQDDAKTSQFTGASLADRQARKIDLSTWIFDFPLQSALLLFPHRQAYTEVPLAPGDGPPAIAKSEVGTEKLDGHTCKKFRITVSEQDQSIDVFTWEAADMKGFPIQVMTPHGDIDYTIRFADVKLEKPKAALFQVPAGYQHYDSLQDLLAADGAKPK
jgi:hypothetical protein